MFLKTFRLFVSSTFADFGNERELLKTRVFPALDAYCAARGYQFHALDLRWGVNEEAQLDQRTVEICLGEVRATQGYPPPNFLIMLGSRYGWVPLPYAIARDEFEAILAWLDEGGEQDAANALRYVYVLDENHLVPPGLIGAGGHEEGMTSAFTLRSRASGPADLRDTATWARLESQLRSGLQDAADQFLKEGRINARAHRKYVSSLTEQEICEHLDASAELSSGSEAIAFIRELSGASDFATREPDPRSARALDALKARIGRRLADAQIVRATATWEDSGTLPRAYLDTFAAAIEGKLMAAVDRHIAKVEALEQASDFALVSERAEHRAFAEEKRRVFVGRESNLSSMAHYLTSRSVSPLILHGRSGLGKSALMARAIADAEAADKVPVLFRFVGASAASSNLRSLLVSLAEDLAAHGLAELPAEFDQDDNKFCAQIKALLASITAPAIIFLDALDQLKRPYRLDWLPETLPDGLKIVFSVLDDPAYEADSEVHHRLRQRHPSAVLLSIEPLTSEHGRDILAALERDARCRLQPSQREYVIAQLQAAGASPLYLKTAFEIARSWRSADEAGQGRQVLAGDTTGVIAQFFDELVDAHHHELELVSATLGYLAAAKDGLSAKELSEVLSRDTSVMEAVSSEHHGARTGELPTSVWVRLHRQLSPLLTERRIDDQPLLHFFHRQVADVARTRHDEPRPKLHAALAAYFEGRALMQDGRTMYEKRSLSELPYQLHHAGNAIQLKKILLNPDWMQQKLKAFGAPRPLIEDFARASTPEADTDGVIAEYVRVFPLIAPFAAEYPEQIYTQLLARLCRSRNPRTREALRDYTPVGAWLELYTDSLATVDERQTHRLVAGQEGVVLCDLSDNNQTAIGVGKDKRIYVWDLEKHGALVTVLQGHTSHIRSCAVSGKGTHVISGTFSGSLRIWEVNSERCTHRFNEHSGAIFDCDISADGNLAISASDDGTVRVWNLIDKSCKWVLADHDGAVYSVELNSDATLAVSGSHDQSVRIWDLATGKCRDVIRVGRGAIRKCSFSDDGKRIALVSSAYWVDDTGIYQGSDDGIAVIVALPRRSNARARALFEYLQSLLGMRRATSETIELDATADMLGTIGGYLVHRSGIPRRYLKQESKVVFLSTDEAGRKWSLSEFDFKDQISHCHLSADGKSLAICIGAVTQIYSLDSGLSAPAIELREATSVVGDAAFTSTHASAATASFDGDVNVWRLGPIDPISTRNHGSSSNIQHSKRRAPATVSWCTYTPGADQILYLSDMRVYTASPALRHEISSPLQQESILVDLRNVAPASPQLGDIALSFASSTLLVAGGPFRGDHSKATSVMWERQHLGREFEFGEPISLVALSHDGARGFAISSENLHILEMTGGAVVRVPLKLAAEPTCCLASPAGDRIVICTEVGQMALISITEEPVVAMLPGHEEMIVCIDLVKSDFGYKVISIDLGGQIRRWDLDTGRLEKSESLPSIERRFAPSDQAFVKHMHDMGWICGSDGGKTFFVIDYINRKTIANFTFEANLRCADYTTVRREFMVGDVAGNLHQLRLHSY